MNRAAAVLALSALAAVGSAPAAAQEPVRYEIAFPDRLHHEARITVRFPDVGPGPLELRMSRTSPGRYALHEFAKNVYGFEAEGVGGRAVEVARPDPHQWNVLGHGGDVTVSYTLFGDHADGTYTGIDETHAHLNMPATFLWARGLEARPVEVTFRIPEGSGWRVATQLVPTSDPGTFTAPDLAYFMDSPTELSAFGLREWSVPGPGGRSQTVRVAVHHTGTEADLDRYAEGVRAIVEAERAVWGEMPLFDHGTYTFIACYVPWADGDGMEHRNSTILTSTASLEGGMVGLWGTVAHEFFHAWNVERIRPASLEPFDFEGANMSRELWFGEGFTSYYDDVALVRGGLIDVSAFARRIGGSIDFVVNAPGRRFFSPVEMSMQAPFVDAAVSVDPVNRDNTFISYYTWGSVVGVGLDLTLRTRFPGVTLDDYMRAVWERHGRTEIPYTVDDLEAVLAGVTGDTAFAASFFDRFVRGRDVPDYGALLREAGLVLREARPGRAMLARARLVPADDGLLVASPTAKGSPLHEAGLDRRDVLLSVDGRPVPDVPALARILEGRRPGDRVRVVWLSRGVRQEGEAVLAEDPALEVVTAEEAGEQPGPAALRLREAWLGG